MPKVFTWEDIARSSETGGLGLKMPEGMEIVRVVGLTFVGGYPENILTLADLHANRGTVPSVQLIRNPGNKFDSNAIEVHIDDKMVGHLPKDVAVRIAPTMDNGSFKPLASVHQIRISFDNPKNPGLDILVEMAGR